MLQSDQSNRALRGAWRRKAESTSAKRNPRATLNERRATEPPDVTETATDDATESPTAITKSHATDAFGDRGNALDIDA